MKYLFNVILVLWAAGAHAWEEPARGTADRKALMDAIRPHAEWHLGAPVEFVVYDLRRAGDVGFANLWAQRPGGGQIDMSRTPMAQRGGYDPQMGDGASIQALYRKAGDTWVAVHWALGATDVWYAAPELFCHDYRAVLTEICEN